MDDVRTMRKDVGDGTPHRATMTCYVYLTLVGSYGDTSYEPPPGYEDEPHEVEMTVYAYFASVNGDWHIDRRMQEDLPGFVCHVGCSHDHHDKTLGSRDCPLFRDSDVYRAICQPPSLRELRVMQYVPDRNVKVPRVARQRHGTT